MILITGGLDSIGSHTARDETSTALATRIEETSRTQPSPTSRFDSWLKRRSPTA
jgi:hypothetical protein